MTAPNELIEKVARAILDARHPGAADHAFQFDTLNKSAAVEQARTAIIATLEAIREPDGAARHAGGVAYDFPSAFMSGPSQQGQRTSARVFAAMIDSILASLRENERGS